MKPQKKPKTESSTLMVRILFYLHGKDEQNPNLMHFKLDIKKAEYFSLAFQYADDYKKEIYDEAIKQLKRHPERLIHLLRMRESGYYEMVAQLNCILIYDKDDNVIDENTIWKINDPKVYQLTDDEVDLIPEEIKTGVYQLI